MRWEKLGLVYGPDGSSSWARHSALQPTPLLLSPDVIRVFAGFRDDEGISRVGSVDLDARNPMQVLAVSDRPILDVGTPGRFDDNGVVPCALARRGEEIFLYYAGYQIPKRVKFVAFSGLAVSTDQGSSFRRYSSVPILERTEAEPLFRAIHSIREEDGRWRVWYGGGGSWIEDGGRVLPVYDVRYMESSDGLNFPKTFHTAVTFNHPDEFRIGRPFVIRTGDLYRMFYGTARRGTGYRLGYAESHDGVMWIRKDEQVGIDVATSGWDSGMVAYPSVITAGDNTYMFYNGGDMGRRGFGCAVLTRW